jgi:hypothetical protein
MDMRKYSGETYIKTVDVRGGPLRAKIALSERGNMAGPTSSLRLAKY